MGTQLSTEKRAHPSHPFFGPYLLWPNGWIDEDATWYGSRPQPRPHCIRRGPSSPRKGQGSPLLFGPCLLRPRSPISATAELLLSIDPWHDIQKLLGYYTSLPIWTGRVRLRLEHMCSHSSTFYKRIESRIVASLVRRESGGQLFSWDDLARRAAPRCTMRDEPTEQLTNDGVDLTI